MTASRDILVVAPDRWDESCFAVPALRALQAAGLGVGVLCSEAQAGFWRTLPQVEVLAFPRRARVREVAATIGGGWQSAVLWEPGTAAEAVTKAAVPRRIGPAGGRLAKLLTHPYAAPAEPLAHRVRFYLSVIEGMGIETKRPEFFAPATSPDLGTPETGTLLVCPDSDFGPSHEWPLERWQELAHSLVSLGWRLTVAGIPGGRNLGRALAATTGDPSRFFEVEDAAATLPLLAAHALTVAADGSLPHLAAHAGSTCITLFGPNDPVWKRPLGRRHRAVRRHVECAPCLAAKCPLDQRCQSELMVDRVIAAITEIQNLPAPAAL